MNDGLAYKLMLALKLLAKNDRGDGLTPCWCSASNQPARDHSPSCQAALSALRSWQKEEKKRLDAARS